MRCDKELNLALKILLMFIVITSSVKLMLKLSNFLYTGIKADGLKSFIEVYLIWFAVILAIVVSLYLYIKKTEGGFSLTFLKNPMVRLTAGLLILFQGLSDILISIPAAFSNITTFLRASADFENAIGTSRGHLLILNIIPSLVYRVQILLGLYFIFYRKRNKEKG